MVDQGEPAVAEPDNVAARPLEHLDTKAFRLDQQLCFLLYSTVNRMTRLYRPVLKAMGLTFPQYLTLLALWESAPRTVGSLGEALDLDSGTLTPILKRLEQQNLVRRRRDPDDERRVLVDLTDGGEALRAQAAKVPAEMLCKINLPISDLGRLRDQMLELNAHLGDA